MKKFLLATALIAIGFVSTADAAATSCAENFFGGVAPDVTVAAMMKKTYPLCYAEFGVLYSGLTRTPLWSADHLTAARVATARTMTRAGALESFHPELSVPPGDRSELADYTRSGYDRGHMSPNGDMDSPAAQGESFTLGNMIPQWPSQNRGIWEEIEETTRGLATKYGEVYVVTMPVFAGAQTTWLKNRVAIPVQTAKAVYIPSLKAAAVYISDNNDQQNWKVISVAELQSSSGVDPFPKLDESVKKTAYQLPAPAKQSRYQ